MDNPEILSINVREYRRGNQKRTMQRYWQINVREYRRGNQKWTIERHWQTVSLDCPFLIAPSVFSNVYLSVSLDCAF
jgi:hypothetical protein